MGESFPDIPAPNTESGWGDLERNNIIKGTNDIIPNLMLTGSVIYPEDICDPILNPFTRLRFTLEEIPDVATEIVVFGLISNYSHDLDQGAFYGIKMTNSVLYGVNGTFSVAGGIVLDTETAMVMALTNMDTERFYLDVAVKSTGGVDIYVYPETNPDGNGELCNVPRKNPTAAGMVGLAMVQSY